MFMKSFCLPFSKYPASLVGAFMLGALVSGQTSNEAARSLLTQADSSLEKVRDSSPRAILFRLIARAKASIGDNLGAKDGFHWASLNASKIVDPSAAWTSFEEIFKAQNESSDPGSQETLQLACETAATIPDINARASALFTLSKDCVSMEGQSKKAKAMANVALVLSIDKAKAEPDELARAHQYGAIAGVVAVSGDFEKAANFVDKIDETINPSFGYEKSIAQQLVASATATQGHPSAAEALVSKMKAGYMKDFATWQVAGAYARDGDMLRANSLIPTIADKYLRSRGSLDVCVAQAKNGHISEATKLADDQSDGFLRSIAYLGIALAQAKSKDDPGLKVSLSRVTDPGVLQNTLAELAGQQASMGEMAAAVATIGTITDPFWKTWALASAARARH